MYTACPQRKLSLDTSLQFPFPTYLQSYTTNASQFDINEMQLYNVNGALPLKSFTFDIKNLPRLRRDTHIMSDCKGFVFVPKSNTWRVYFLPLAEGYGRLFHNRQTQTMRGTSVPLCQFRLGNIRLHIQSRGKAWGQGPCARPWGRLGVFGRTRRQHAPSVSAPAPKKATGKHHRRARTNDRGWWEKSRD